MNLKNYKPKEKRRTENVTQHRGGLVFVLKVTGHVFSSLATGHELIYSYVVLYNKCLAPFLIKKILFLTVLWDKFSVISFRFNILIRFKADLKQIHNPTSLYIACLIAGTVFPLH